VSKFFVINIVILVLFSFEIIQAKGWVYIDSTHFQIFEKKASIDTSLVLYDILKKNVVKHYIEYDIISHQYVCGYYNYELLKNKFKFDLDKYFYMQLTWRMKLDDYCLYFYEWYERDYLFVMILSSNKLFLSFYSNTDRFVFFKTVQNTGNNSLNEWALDSNIILSINDSYDGRYFKQIVDNEKQKKGKPLLQKYITINKVMYNVYRLVEPSSSPSASSVIYFSKSGQELKNSMKGKKNEFNEWQINEIVDSLSKIESEYKPLTSIFYIKWYGVILLAYDYKNDRVIKYFVPTLYRPGYNIW
jgi:hypothetical protein